MRSLLANKEVEKAVSKEANAGKKREVQRWLHQFDDPLDESGDLSALQGHLP